MSDRAEDDAFLARWSRRKAAARQGEPLPEPPAPESAPAAAPAAAAAAATPTEAKPPEPLPPIESLRGLESDYKAFMQPGVAEDVKRAAIKKLFADPKFNVMDGLDVYIDDYTQFEPLPAEMLGRIAAVKHLFRSPEPERTAEPAPEREAADDATVPEASGDHGEAGNGGPLPDGSAPLAGGTFRTKSAVLEPVESEKPCEERNSTDS